MVHAPMENFPKIRTSLMREFLRGRWLCLGQHMVKVVEVARLLLIRRGAFNRLTKFAHALTLTNHQRHPKLLNHSNWLPHRNLFKIMLHHLCHGILSEEALNLFPNNSIPQACQLSRLLSAFLNPIWELKITCLWTNKRRESIRLSISVILRWA